MGTDFVYQWIDCDAHSVTDLQYSLRSLESNWIGNYRVTLVGDKPRGYADLYHVPHTKLEKEHDARALDAARKLETITRMRHIQEQFVLMHDDNYLLQPMDMMYLLRRRAVNEVDLDKEPAPHSRKWNKLLFNTARCLRDKGFKRVWNYETHIPRVYEKRKLAEVMDLYRPAGNRLLTATLYFNHHFRHQEPELLHPHDDCKVAFFGTHDRNTVGPAPTKDVQQGIRYYLQHMVGKHFMNHNMRGMADPNLQYARHSLWPTASSHEPRGILDSTATPAL